MKKKITYKQWQEIAPYNYAVKWLRPFCSYSLIKEGEIFKREQRTPLWFYLITFIPIHLVKAIYCMWNGGLKEFEIEGRYLGDNYLGLVGTPTWEKAKEIWENQKESRQTQPLML